MHGAQACHFLKNNQLISNAVVSDAGGRSALIRADISPHGHEMICKNGLQGLSKYLQDELYSIDRREYHLEFREVHNRIGQWHESGGPLRRAPILSWISNHPTHRLLLKVHPEIVFMKGHFPNRPILAGVVQVHWAVSIAMSILGFSDAPTEIKRLKFKNIVQPPVVLELLLNQKKGKELEFQFTSHGKVHSSGCLAMTGTISC